MRRVDKRFRDYLLWFRGLRYAQGRSDSDWGGVVAERAENKLRGPLLEMIKAYQDQQPPEKRGNKGPSRRDQIGQMFDIR